MQNTKKLSEEFRVLSDAGFSFEKISEVEKVSIKEGKKHFIVEKKKGKGEKQEDALNSNTNAAFWFSERGSLSGYAAAQNREISSGLETGILISRELALM
uniref:Uncharacterized protein n=1 Tax=Rhizophagus irregularis (strain DAOM 181602 / DAOM 197198 / MUCL 43194) TaxID=747089 RepID=U9UIW1_RHIID